MIDVLKYAMNLTKNRAVVGRVAMIIFVFAIAPVSYASLTTGEPTANSITLNWTAPGDDGNTGTASQYDIRYSTANINDANWGSATQVSNEPIPHAAGVAESLIVIGLQPSTAYYFAIKTGDEIPNWSGLSNVATETTAAESIPPRSILNLATSNPSSSSITLSWTAPGDDSVSGTASQYDIRYSTSLITDANWGSATQVSGEPTPLPAGQSQTFIVTGLQSNTTYYFAIKTADEVPNWSGLSNVPTGITTQELIPPRNITNLATSNPTGSSITLTWTAPGDDSSSGTASQYDIRYSFSPITNGNFASATQVSGEPTPLPSGQSQTFAVTGLQSGRTYYFAMKTADEVPNWSGLSNVVIGTTVDTTPPSAINDLQADAGFEIASPAWLFKHQTHMI
jgi:phosphodiesterase/alkaline phosphatase D-like protein